ncbi:MAG: SCO family protein [Rhodobacteraceae bacterium]|jgi:protein SCO1|nr:SCO family protein [Paracoccaceae bacterium]
MGVLLAGSLGYVLLNRPQDAFSACRGGVAAGQIGGPFTLVDSTGATVTDRDVITQPSLVYFGYTFCPDVCPFDNARNAQAVDILEERGIAATPIFITIDPARDTPEVMAEYTANVHPAMIGLTGSDEQIKAAANAYRALYQRRETGDENYLMDHSVFTYLMMPETGFADFFQRDATPEQIADSVACFAGA